MPIIDYVNDKNDKELINLIGYLKHIKDVDDLQETNRNLFRFKELTSCQPSQEAIINLFIT